MKNNILLSLAITLCAINCAFTQTNWGSDITTNYTWTISMSPIVLTNNISVIGDGTILTIDNGVEVNFNNYSITVQNNNNFVGNNVLINNYPTLIIDGNCNIQYCTFYGAVVNINGSIGGTRTFDGNTFNDSYINITDNIGTASITNNTFTSTLTESTPIGLWGELPNPTITGNTFASGSKIGIGGGVTTNRNLPNYQGLPYYIGERQTFNIGENATLTIASGVTVIDELDYSGGWDWESFLNVAQGGTLNATGVTFISLQSSISLRMYGNCNIQYCTFYGAVVNINGSIGGTRTFDGNTFNDSYINITDNIGTASITNNTFTSTLTESTPIGLWGELPNPTITGNTFASGSKIGIGGGVTTNRNLPNYQGLPYYIGERQTFNIGENATLTIASGVTVIDELDYSGGWDWESFLNVAQGGTLNATGVTFISLQSSISLRMYGNCNIQYCTFYGAVVNINGSIGGTRTFDGNTFNDSYINITDNIGTASITNNTFTSTLTESTPIGLWGELPNPTITGNTFASGSKIGIGGGVTTNRNLPNYQGLPYYIGEKDKHLILERMLL